MKQKFQILWLQLQKKRICCFMINYNDPIQNVVMERDNMDDTPVDYRQACTDIMHCSQCITSCQGLLSIHKCEGLTGEHDAFPSNVRCSHSVTKSQEVTDIVQHCPLVC